MPLAAESEIANSELEPVICGWFERRRSSPLLPDVVRYASQLEFEFPAFESAHLPPARKYGKLKTVKTTIEIPDQLADDAKL
jgi:hypothetical protein